MIEGNGGTLVWEPDGLLGSIGDGRIVLGIGGHGGKSGSTEMLQGHLHGMDGCRWAAVRTEMARAEGPTTIPDGGGGASITRGALRRSLRIHCKVVAAA